MIFFNETIFAGLRIAIAFATALGLAVLPAAASTAPDTGDLSSAPLRESAPLFLAEPGLPDASFQIAFSDSNTNQVVSRLNQAERECGQLPAEYRADCLQQGYRSAESATRNHPDYATAGTQLSRVSRSISGLVSQNEDKAAKPIVRGGKRYRAVKKSAVRSVNAKAAAIIGEAETKLLRSAGSGHRKTHYQRIAQAVGSTKKILRS